MNTEAKPSEARRTWEKDDLAFEAWKYFASVGGSDKDRMIHIATWLLGFSAGIVGLQSTGKVTDSQAGGLLAVLGVLVSAVAAFVALLYGVYASWNWAIADEIADAYRWLEALPKHDPFQRWPAHWSIKPILWLGRPRPGQLAPVFWLFFGVSIVSLVVHLIMLLHLDYQPSNYTLHSPPGVGLGLDFVRTFARRG